MLQIKPLLVASFANIFSQSIAFFILLMVFCTEAFKFEQLPLFVLILFLLLWETDLRKHWYCLFQRMFCFCSLLGVLWRLVLYLSLQAILSLFLCVLRISSGFIDLHEAVQLFQNHLLKRLSFPYPQLLVKHILTLTTTLQHSQGFYFSLLYKRENGGRRRCSSLPKLTWQEVAAQAQGAPLSLQLWVIQSERIQSQVWLPGKAFVSLCFFCSVLPSRVETLHSKYAIIICYNLESRGSYHCGT